MGSFDSYCNPESRQSRIITFLSFVIPPLMFGLFSLVNYSFLMHDSQTNACEKALSMCFIFAVSCT
jgi:hypothetical protein